MVQEFSPIPIQQHLRVFALENFAHELEITHGTLEVVVILLIERAILPEIRGQPEFPQSLPVKNQVKDRLFELIVLGEEARDCIHAMLHDVTGQVGHIRLRKEEERSNQQDKQGIGGNLWITRSLITHCLRNYPNQVLNCSIQLGCRDGLVNKERIAPLGPPLDFFVASPVFHLFILLKWTKSVVDQFRKMMVNF